jgi:chromosome segregation ATPase
VPGEAAVLRQTSDDHPAVKIIALLEKLSAQVKAEGQAEEVEYATFSRWCTDLKTAKEKAIKEAQEEMDVASATIRALETDIFNLEWDIKGIQRELDRDQERKDSGVQQREDDNNDYLDRKSDMEECIQVMGDSITEIEASMELTQVSASSVKQAKTPAQRVALKKALELIKIYSPKGSQQATQFLQRAVQEPEIDAPEATSYVPKGGGIVDILKELKAKFEGDLKKINDKEIASVAAHALFDAGKQAEIDSGNEAKDTKNEIMGRKGQDLATAESELTEATNNRDAAQTVLDETTATCNTRESEWKERSERREGEMKAMKQASEILTKVTGVRKPSDKLDSVAYSFLQKSSDPRAKIVNLLRQAATKTKAKELTKLADKIAAISGQAQAPGVFDEIKNMIEKMIFHLMSEQKDEDDHKNWCDKELKKTEKMVEVKTTKKEALQTSIDELTATIAQLDDEMKENTKAISALDAAMETATEDRNAERAENTATIKDAQDAQTAVSNAIAVLEDFYKGIGGVPKESWEGFIQSKRAKKLAEDPPPPETSFEGQSYSGTEGGTGVIDLLTDVASDFASMEAQARTDETTQQQEYDTWMTGSKEDRAAKSKDNEMKSSRKSTLETKLEGKETDYAHNTKELETAEKYLEDLQPACVEGDSSYEDRKAARTQEIEALKSAEGILEDAFEQ